MHLGNPPDTQTFFHPSKDTSPLAAEDGLLFRKQVPRGPQLKYARDNIIQLLLPYIELARVAKPVGVITIYLPYLLGVLLAGIHPSSTYGSDDIDVFALHAWILLSAGLLRSAGCAWNDVVDRELDQLVLRSRLRPVARGAIGPRAGTVFSVAVTIAWLLVVAKVNAHAVPLAIANIPLVIIYPYAKRFTNYPQAVLGLTLSWGIVTAYRMTCSAGFPPYHEDRDLYAAIAGLATAWTAFTMFFDTIYAYQDIADDDKAGIYSTASTFGTAGKYVLGLFTLIQAVSLFAVSRLLSCSGPGAVWSIAMASAQAYAILKVNLYDPHSCKVWFQRIILVALALMWSCLVLARPDTILQGLIHV